MRVLQIHTSLSGGGIQAVVCNLANELFKKNIDVTVCSISQPNEKDIFWNKINENIKKITLGKKGGGFSIPIVFKIYKYLKSNKYDIVHIHGFFCYYFLSVLLLHHRIKFVYTLHSDAYKENGKWDRRFFMIKKYSFKKKWILPITISHASQESFFSLYDCKSKLVYNGIPKPEKVNTDDFKDVEVNTYRYTAKTKVFVHVGRIDLPKNQIVLCNVFQRLIDDGCDVVLLIVGGVTSSDIFKKIQPFFNDRIVYLGPRDNISQLMSQCDAMCLTSLWEGLPIVLLEALSVGCIPICSPVGGIVNVITHGVNGILSKSSNFDDYYQAIRCFLELTDKNKKVISSRCLESFKQYTVEQMAQNYLSAYLDN